MVTPDFPPARGGIQLLVHRVVSHWTHVRASVVTLAAAGADGFDSAQPFRVVRVDRLPGAGHKGRIGLLNARALLEARRLRPHVVLSGHIVTSPAAITIRTMASTPFVQYLYADEIPERPHLSRFALRRASAVVAISEHTAALARGHGVSPDRLHRIPPGVDLALPVKPSRFRRPTVITISRLADRYKGHDVMIQAMPLIRARVPDVLWAVIGEGQLRGSLEAKVRERGLSGCVRFLGAVGDRERDGWLDRAHVLAMPSRLPERGGGEGFGIVYLEAAIHGLPVVAGNVGGAVDAVLDGETGTLVDPTDPIAVADAIIELLLDPARSRSIGERAAARARAFSWPDVARRVETVLNAVAANRR